MNQELTKSCFLLAAFFPQICVRYLTVVKKAAHSNPSVYIHPSYWFITARHYVFPYIEFHLLICPVSQMFSSFPEAL